MRNSKQNGRRNKKEKASAVATAATPATQEAQQMHSQSVTTTERSGKMRGQHEDTEQTKGARRSKCHPELFRSSAWLVIWLVTWRHVALPVSVLAFSLHGPSVTSLPS